MRGGEIPEVGLEGCFQGELLAWRAVHWGSPLLYVCFWGLFSERSMTSPFAEELVCFRMYQWRRQWQPTPVLLPGKSHGWRMEVHRVTKSRRQLSDFTFTFHFHSLEKEMATHSSILAWRIPGQARWAAIYGVAQSRTRLKRLSSSSSSSRMYQNCQVFGCEESRAWVLWVMFVGRTSVV